MTRSPLFLLALFSIAVTAAQGGPRMSTREMFDAILAATRPLPHPRGARLPFYSWHLTGIAGLDDATAEDCLRRLDQHGLAVQAAWHNGDRDASLAEALRLARLQHKLGLDINISCIQPLYGFFNGDPGTAHVDADGKPFFDLSFDKNHPIGCPFAVRQRAAAVRAQVEFFLDAYAREGLPVDFIFSDWEIDGPLEWNDAWAHAKRCRRCRENLPGLDDFGLFQRAVRGIRGDLQRECFAEPVLRRFPQARVGNYAVYPDGGVRYWYDYFETVPDDRYPVIHDQRAVYRHWVSEFAGSGYTFGMPVIYTWYPIFGWYDDPDADFRWFRALLLEGSASSAAKPAGLPLITFIHQHTTSPPEQPDPAVKPFAPERYQELLWHLLLRGHDTFFVWSPVEEGVEETRLGWEVYAAALQYCDFLERGRPVSFAVPEHAGPVVSGLRLGDRVLVRRTDFGAAARDVALELDGRVVHVPPAPGRCQVLDLPRSGAQQRRDRRR
ncbi:MAG: hypothetical protein HYU66_05375 [Armatimonadetes bacterium]|nr:hypothetical protein [Armatimonadota bacterium]